MRTPMSLLAAVAWPYNRDLSDARFPRDQAKRGNRGEAQDDHRVTPVFERSRVLSNLTGM